jgi:hypothetical protein
LQEHYEIRPSATQRNILLSSHGLVAAAIYFYLEPASLMLPALAAVCLFNRVQARQTTIFLY